MSVLPGDPAPPQLCALLVLKCAQGGNSVEWWRPSDFALEFGVLVLLMGLRCAKCGGEVIPTVAGHAYMVPEGPVDVSAG
jgi:hypothetical protein